VRSTNKQSRNTIVKVEIIMSLKKYVIGSALAITFIGGAVAQDYFAGHPDISTAMSATSTAIGAMERAQQIHQYQMGGHAQNAINLLGQAKAEMRMSIGAY
jgi:hypothetical protein